MNDRAGTLEGRAHDAAAPISPIAPGSRYLSGLLAKQQGLNAAKDKLLARAAACDADEASYIGLKMEMIHAEHLIIAAMVTAYLQEQTVTRMVSVDGLASIRRLVEQLQAVEAARVRAHDIVVMVSRLLNEWDGDGRAD